jgi:integrase
VNKPSAAAVRLRRQDELAVEYAAVAERGSVKSYVKKGHTYWRIRIMVEGETREIYSDLGRPFRDEEHVKWVLVQVQGLLRKKDCVASIAEYLPKQSKPNLVFHHLQEYAKDLAERHRLKEVSHYTVENFMRRMPKEPAADTQHFRFWDGVSVGEIKARHLEKFKRHLEGLGQAPSSVKLSMDQFLAFLAWCVRWEVISIVPPAPPIKVVSKRPRILTPIEQRMVLEQIPWVQRGIFLALCLGMRPGAARAALVEDVQGGFLLVHRGMQSRNAEAEASDHTKARKESWLPLSKDLGAWLEEHTRDRLPTALLFWNPRGTTKGQRWGHGSLGNVWKRACEAAGLPPARLYAGTKHSFATGRLMAGKSKDAVGEFMQISARQVDTYAQWARELSAQVLDEEDMAPETKAKILALRGK